MFRRRLVLVVAGAFLLRLAYVIWYEQTHIGPGGDAFYYHWQANALAEGLGFVEPYAWTCDGVLAPSAAHPPLYSLYLALFSALGGTTTLVHRIATVLAGTGTVLLVGLAGREWRNERTGVVAATLAAVAPFLWVNDALLMSETVFGTTIALVLWTSLRYRRAPGRARAAWLGVAVGLATLVRAEAILLVPFLLLPLFALAPPREGSLPAPPRRERGRHLGVAALCVLAVLAPWAGHNLTRFERPVLLSTGLGSVLAVANCDTTYAGRYLGLWSIACARDLDHEHIGRDASVEPEITGKVGPVFCISYPDGLDSRLGDESEQEIIRRRASIEYVRGHVGDLVRVVPARLGRTFEVFRPADGIVYGDFVENRGKWASRAGQWSFFVLALAGIASARRARRERLPLLEIGAMLALVVVTTVVTYGNVRFRLPLDVALTMLVAISVTAWLDRRGSSGETATDPPPPAPEEGVPTSTP